LSAGIKLISPALPKRQEKAWDMRSPRATGLDSFHFICFAYSNLLRSILLRCSVASRSLRLPFGLLAPFPSLRSVPLPALLASFRFGGVSYASQIKFVFGSAASGLPRRVPGLPWSWPRSSAGAFSSRRLGFPLVALPALRRAWLVVGRAPAAASAFRVEASERG